MTLVCDVERLQLEVLAAALMPPDKIDYLKFAENHVFFEEGPVRGRYNRRLFPYFDAVLTALGPDDPCRYVTLAASAQCGKTVAATIFCLGSATLGRGSFLFCHPSEENAIRFAKMKLLPLMNSTPIVAEAFPQRTKSAQASVLYKERADGLSRILLSGANSPASLSQITINNAVYDDVSKWQASPSGDPEIMAESRSRAIADAKIFRISTPMLAQGCRVTSAFKQGSQEMPFVPCVHCGHSQILEWSNMLAQLNEVHPENACFSCIECGGIFEERHRPQMLAGFEWRPDNPSVMPPPVFLDLECLFLLAIMGADREGVSQDPWRPVWRADVHERHHRPRL